MAELGLGGLARGVAAALAALALLLPGALFTNAAAHGVNDAAHFAADHPSHPHYPPELAAVPHDHGSPGDRHGADLDDFSMYRLAGPALPPPRADLLSCHPIGGSWASPGSDEMPALRRLGACFARGPPFVS